MLRHGLRLGVAILTFSIGIAIFWPLRVIQRMETALVDRFYDHDLSTVAITFDSVSDANEVYGALIHERFTVKDKLIVICSETTGFRMLVNESMESEWKYPDQFHNMMKELMPEAEAQTLDDYLSKNETSEQLKVWNLDINYVLVKRSDLPPGVDDFWARFDAKYPNSSGLIFFSNVGFNERHDQAFVYVARNCGGLCGSGGYVLLKKINGKWEIVNEQNMWLS